MNQVQDRITPQVQPPAIELVQGTHIVLNHPSPKGVYYVESPLDRRAVFIMPWDKKTLVGTTELKYTGDPAQIKPTEHEIEYLLGIMRFYFSAASQEVETSFAGARVLPSALSRMHSLK